MISANTSSEAREAQLRELLKARPNDAEAHKQLGDVYFRQSRHEEAEQQYSQALELASGLAQARWTVVTGAARQGVDASAAASARAAGGRVVLVAAHGHDRFVTPPSIDLDQFTSEDGSLISAFPPGSDLTSSSASSSQSTSYGSSARA